MEIKVLMKYDLQKALELFESKRYGDAYDLLLPLGKKGDVEAQFALGCIFEFGLGQNRNGDLAIAWYEKSAKGGHALAANNLSNLYGSNFPGVPVNQEKAVYWKQESVRLGFPFSQE